MLTAERIEKFQKLKEQAPKLNIVSLLSKSDLVDSLDDNARTIVVHKLFDSDLCTIKDLIDGYKEKNKLDALIGRQKIFKELMQNNKLTNDDLKYLLNKINKHSEFDNLIKNTSLLKYIIENDILSFKELVDKFKICLKLDSLLANKKFFNTLIQNNRLNTEDLRYLLKKIDDYYEVACLNNNNTSLLKYIIDKDIVSFKELVDKLESALYELLRNGKFFKYLIENNKLNIEDLRYLLSKIDSNNELSSLCDNIPLIKEILNEFILDEKVLSRFSTILENDDWRTAKKIHTLFDLIEYENKNDEEILELNELNKYVCSFDLNEDQRLELFELIQNNKIARNRLIQIIDNNLEDQYDFESLKNLLTKDNNKKKIKMNF